MQFSLFLRKLHTLFIYINCVHYLLLQEEPEFKREASSPSPEPIESKPAKAIVKQETEPPVPQKPVPERKPVEKKESKKVRFWSCGFCLARPVSNLLYKL